MAGTQIELLEAQQNQDLLDEQEFYAEVNVISNPSPVGLERDPGQDQKYFFHIKAGVCKDIYIC